MSTAEAPSSEPSEKDRNVDEIGPQCATARIQLYPPRCIRDANYPTYDADGKEIVTGAGYELLMDLVKAGMAYRHAVLYAFMVVRYGDPYLENGMYASHIARDLNRSPQSIRSLLRQMTDLGFFAARRRHQVKFLRYEDLIARLENHRQER